MNPRGTASQIDEKLLAQLREDLALRRIASGIECLRLRAPSLDDLDPRQTNVARFLGHVAQWVDIGFASPAQLKRILVRFDPALRAQLSVRDYLYLRSAEGFVNMAEEDADTAIRHFDFVATLGDELNDAQSLAVVYFWKGRCLRKKGEYDDALTHTLRGRDLALELGNTRMAAVMRVVESWVFFQKGRFREAANILREAQAAKLQQLCDRVEHNKKVNELKIRRLGTSFRACIFALALVLGNVFMLAVRILKISVLPR